jgi:hypothetical protein
MQFRRPVGFWGMYMRSNQRRGEAGGWRMIKLHGETSLTRGNGPEANDRFS